jgi:hypothetical protein
VTALGFRSDWLALIAAVLLVVTVEFALVLWVTAGHFTYTLDDPYIHLALAENLARHGHYGLNLEDYSSPSSSILWPLLLVPVLALGAGIYGPLVLNVAFAVATVLAIHRIIAVCAASNAKPLASLSWIWAFLVFFAANGFGLIFTGMEHSLHVLVTVCVFHLVLRMQLAADAGRVAPSGSADLLLLSCAVLSPLVRFEGMAVSAFAIAMMVRLGKPRLAALAVLLIATALAMYFYAMSALGLPWLPSSVLVKSAAAADVAAQTSVSGKFIGALSHIAGNLAQNLELAEGRLLLAIGIVIAALWLNAWRMGERVPAAFAAGVLAVIALHLAFGRFGWYGRYQAYVFVFAVCALPYLFPGLLFGGNVNKERRMMLGTLGAVIVTMLGFMQHLIPLLTTPLAAQNTYQQQRQMREFAVRYWKAPIAVTDIGYVSFENDHYVLDLWGLGSEEARELNRTRRRDLLPALTVKHDVHLAMISDRLIADVLPSEWRKIAVLQLTAQRITPTDAAVSFYVFGLDRAQCLHVAEQLAEFKSTLEFPQTLAVDVGACEPRDLRPAIKTS